MENSKIQNPVKAILAKCRYCCCGSTGEVEQCPMLDCAIYPFRFGKNPYRTARDYTSEQLEKMRERMRRFKSRDSDLLIATSLEKPTNEAAEGNITTEAETPAKHGTERKRAPQE